MALIKNIESKIRLAYMSVILTLIFSVIIIGMTLLYSNNQINEGRKTMYILDNGVPILVKQTNQQANRPVEYKANVDLFHSLYFTLTPDEKFIEYQMKRAMYLIDETGMQQYNNLKEKGYFSQIMASSAVLTIQTDSIYLDEAKNYFKYFGRQKIERKSSVMYRSLVTEGYIKDVPRSPNNPHGVMIQNWKTLENKDLDYVEKQPL